MKATDDIPDYYIKKVKLNREEEKELILAAQAGSKEARDKMVMAFLPFVTYLARLKSQHRDMDILNAGIQGILVSIDRFDVSKGNRFATFARHWIMEKMIEEMQSKNNLSRMSPKVRKHCIDNNLMNPIDVGEEKFRNLRPVIPSIEKDLIKIQMTEAVRRAVAALGDREADIITNHVMEESCTLNDLGDKYGITRERIRQIEATALQKLRIKLRSLKDLADPEE